MAILTAGTQYQQVLSAIADYYGSGSDQWVGFARYGIGYSEAESVLSQVPGVDIYKNNAGQITGYAYNNPFSNASGGVAGDINSNLQVPTQANGTTFKGSIPASGSVDSGTGNISLNSGAKSTASGTTVASVLGRVTTGIAAVASGARLGANIAESLYNGNPDYWDSTFPTLNPQTWDTIAGTNELGKSVINAIFGIDKSTNRTQMYIPEDAFAYLAYAMAHEGFFREGAGGETIAGDDWSQSQSWYSYYPMPIPYGGVASWEFQSYANRYTNVITADKIVRVGMELLLYSTSQTQFTRVQTLQSTGVSETINISTNHVVVNGKSINYATYTLGSNYENVISPTPYTPSQINYTNIGYLVLYGNSQDASGKEGVEKQDGATYPTTTDWTDPAATKTNIRTQYPDLYNNSIYTDVPQPDGTTQRIIYYPVNMTSTTGSEDETPTNTTVNYNNTYVDVTSSEDLLKTILRYLYQTQTETKEDTPTPPDTPNPTDTGTGSTPTIVPPTGSASALWSVYNPSQAQLNSFGAWLWSSSFIDQVLKLFNNPMQSIIGVHKIFATPAISGTGNIVVGYLDSGIGANLVGAQYTTIDCGSINVHEQFGNIFDYTDTTIRLYLPFIGIVDLDTADVMRGAVHVIYHVDVITGACLAEVKISRDASGGTLYQFAGDAAVRYPISSGSYMGVVAGIASAVGGVASAVMTGGATLPMAAGAIAGGISGAHTQVQHSGNFSGNAGAMGAKKPYLIIERPQSYIADGFESYQGMGANNVRAIADMTGYFKMMDAHLDSVNGATESELEEIKTALERGVIK